MSTDTDFLRMILDFMNDDPLTVYYTKYLAGTYDPATSTSTPVVVETACKGIILDLTRNNNGLSSKFGTEILEGDKELYLYPPERVDITLQPLVVDTTADRVRIGSTTYKVAVMKSCDPTAFAPLLYNLMLRR